MRTLMPPPGAAAPMKRHHDRKEEQPAKQQEAEPEAAPSATAQKDNDDTANVPYHLAGGMSFSSIGTDFSFDSSGDLDIPEQLKRRKKKSSSRRKSSKSDKDKSRDKDDKKDRDKKGSKRDKKKKSGRGTNGEDGQDNTLLDEVFPPHIAAALREGRKVEPESKEMVTIFFSDIVGFTNISSTMISPLKVSDMLDRLYQKFDQLSHQHDVFKVETIGDSWMGATNLIKDQPDHARRVAKFALDAMDAARRTYIDLDNYDFGTIQLRVGFHSGPVVASVVGTRNPRYCLFGDTVNSASRMESNSLPGRIQCSAATAAAIRLQLEQQSTTDITDDDLVLHSRGEIEIKGKGRMETFFVGGDPVVPDATETTPPLVVETAVATAPEEVVVPSRDEEKGKKKKRFKAPSFWKKSSSDATTATPSEKLSPPQPKAAEEDAPQKEQRRSSTGRSSAGRSSTGVFGSMWKKSKAKMSRRTSLDSVVASEPKASALTNERVPIRRASLDSVIASEPKASPPTNARMSLRNNGSNNNESLRSTPKTVKLPNYSKRSDSPASSVSRRSSTSSLSSGSATSPDTTSPETTTNIPSTIKAASLHDDRPETLAPKEKLGTTTMKAASLHSIQPETTAAKPKPKTKAPPKQINPFLAKLIEGLGGNDKVNPEAVVKNMNDVYEIVKDNEDRQQEFGSSSEGIQLFVDVVKRFEDNPEVLEVALRLLVVLAETEANRDALAKQGSIECALGAMSKHPKSSLTQQYGCDSLANFAATPEYQDRIVSCNGIEAIMASQKANAAGGAVQVACFRALNSMAKHNSENASNITAAGGTLALMAALQSKSFPLATVIELHVEGFRAMAQLARENESNRGSIAAAGGIPKLIGGMSCFSRSADLLEAGCDALYCLTIDHAQNSDTIVAYDGFKVVIGLMKKHPAHEGLQERGLVLFYSLMETSMTAQFRTPSDFVEFVEQTMQKHPNLHELGQKLVSTLN